MALGDPDREAWAPARSLATRQRVGSRRQALSRCFGDLEAHQPGRSLLHRTHTPLQAALSCRGELGARATVRARPGGGVTTRLLYDL